MWFGLHGFAGVVAAVEDSPAREADSLPFSGRIALDGVDAGNDLSADSVTVHLSLTNVSCGTLTVETISGSVNVPRTVTGGICETKTTSRNIDIS